MLDCMMVRSRRLNLPGSLWAALATALLICSGCGATTEKVPVNHRASDAQCSTPAPAGDCAGPGPEPGGCTTDSMCTAGTNGRCLHPGGGPAADCFCTYDTCIHDTDCPAGQTCACHGAPYTDGVGNTCIKGKCRVDSDCGVGGYCSPSAGSSICGDSLLGYFCHTAADLCTDDSDCSGDTDVYLLDHELALAVRPAHHLRLKAGHRAMRGQVSVFRV
jgi:hypothetical protein